MIQNQVSIELTEQEVQQANQAIQTLNTILDKKLIALKSKERQRLPKMGDSSMPFVDKVIEYATLNPEFLPPYVDVVELKKDFVATKLLNQLLQPLDQLVKKLTDTRLVTGSEAYVAALAYYNSVKGAAKVNVLGAEVVEADLATRFARRNGSDATDEVKG